MLDAYTDSICACVRVYVHVSAHARIGALCRERCWVSGGPKMTITRLHYTVECHGQLHAQEHAAANSQGRMLADLETQPPASLAKKVASS